MSFSSSFDVTAFPVMFTLIFTYLFGGALAGSTDAYLQYLLPGILVQTVVFITIYTGFGLNTDITKGVFDRFRSLPVWRPATLVGALLGDAARYAMASAMVIVLGLVLGFRPDGGVLGVLMSVALLLVFSFALSWIWTALGLVLRTRQTKMCVQADLSASASRPGLRSSLGHPSASTAVVIISYYRPRMNRHLLLLYVSTA